MTCDEVSIAIRGALSLTMVPFEVKKLENHVRMGVKTGTQKSGVPPLSSRRQHHSRPGIERGRGISGIAQLTGPSTRGNSQMI